MYDWLACSRLFSEQQAANPFLGALNANRHARGSFVSWAKLPWLVGSPEHLTGVLKVLFCFVLGRNGALYFLEALIEHPTGVLKAVFCSGKKWPLEFTPQVLCIYRISTRPLV